MASVQRKFKVQDGLSLSEQCWLPKNGSRAVVVIVHGYAEHIDCYIYVVKYLLRHNYAVYAFDLRGHGKSEGPRVLVNSFNEYVSDLAYFLDRVSKAEPGKPIFLLGHSMGATIITLLAITQKLNVRGLILTGALLRVPDNVSPLVSRIASLAARVFPRLPIKKLNSNFISRDPKVVERYDKDPLIYSGRMLAKEMVELKKAIDRIQAGMDSVSLPLLILHGTADHLVGAKGSKQLYNCACSDDKTLKLYEGLYHAILNEPEKDQVLSDITAWLDKHVG